MFVYRVAFLRERTKTQQFADEYQWLNREQIRSEVCQGNAIHADEIIKVASSKNLSSVVLIWWVELAVISCIEAIGYLWCELCI